MDHLINMGAGETRLDSHSDENTMDFVDRIVNNKNKKDEPTLGNNKQPVNRMADKLDDFNFNFP
jgi:hypothetical protein